mmetsp:Transcript_45591/g.92033  ORF Transcript_45591/g.92033 Transcript_45591/m.92033 type:complete len:233 (-) Transcript_45591:290-988(-)
MHQHRLRGSAEASSSTTKVVQAARAMVGSSCPKSWACTGPGCCVMANMSSHTNTLVGGGGGGDGDDDGDTDTDDADDDNAAGGAETDASLANFLTAATTKPNGLDQAWLTNTVAPPTSQGSKREVKGTAFETVAGIITSLTTSLVGVPQTSCSHAKSIRNCRLTARRPTSSSTRLPFGVEPAWVERVCRGGSVAHALFAALASAVRKWQPPHSGTASLATCVATAAVSGLCS